MRCCIVTLDEVERPADGTPEGTYLKCNWCSGGLVVRDGAWSWPGTRIDGSIAEEG